MIDALKKMQNAEWLKNKKNNADKAWSDVDTI